MKLESIKAILGHLNGFKLIKLSACEYLFFDCTSSHEVKRGGRIVNSRFSVYFSLWLSPLVSFSTMNIAVFSNHVLDSSFGLDEYFFNKSLYSDEEIVKKIQCALDFNLPALQRINDYKQLEVFLESNCDHWLNSSFSVAQYAILLFYNDREEDAFRLIDSIMNSLNENNPTTQEIFLFFELFRTRNLIDLETLLKNNIKKNRARFEELL